MFAVFRSPGEWSEGGMNRRGGRGAKSARRLGGSLSVIVGSGEKPSGMMRVRGCNSQSCC
jgi:hypothetical protein